MTLCSRTIWGPVILCVLALSLGCDKSKKEEPSAAPAEKPVASAAATAEAIELSDDDVPVAEDFIEEATKEIDDSNLNAKLDEIEKEISAE